jgi:RNA-directed DNA polymerase
MLDFLPVDGLSREWLRSIYQTYVFRSKAIGKDGVTHEKFDRALEREVDIIYRKIDLLDYSFTRYKEVLLSSGSDRKPRQISVPTIRDRLALRAALEHLKHAFPEAHSAPPHRYIKDIKTHLAGAPEDSYFLRMDIRDFYPSIQQDLLLSILRDRKMDDRFISLIGRAIANPTGNSENAPQIGIPQGLSISNILAAIYMIDFDKIASSEIFYRRYVDDILVIDEKDNISHVHEALKEGLKNIGLASHPLGTPGKTDILKRDDGVEYLGYHISAQKTAVRRESIARMFANLSKVLTSIKRSKNYDKHIYRLNLKITGCVINNSRRGWLMFFSQTDDISQLAFIDSWLLTEGSKIAKLGRAKFKTFKRSYYEIRYNLSDTDYVPNFDKYDLQQKTDVVRILSNRTPEQVQVMDVQVIESEFVRLVGKEISELERDLMQAFS